MGRQQPGGQHRRDGADRHGHQEDHPPAQAQHVGAQQQAAEHLAGDGAHPTGHAVPAQGRGPGVGREDPGDHRQHLRHHDRAGQALGQPGEHQLGGVGGQPAQQRGDGEGEHAQDEHAAVADQVAEPAAGDHAGRVGERVPADDQLQRGRAGAQVAVQRGRGDVDDEEVELGQELRGQQHGQQHARVSRSGGEHHLYHIADNRYPGYAVSTIRV